MSCLVLSSLFFCLLFNQEYIGKCVIKKHTQCVVWIRFETKMIFSLLIAQKKKTMRCWVLPQLSKRTEPKSWASTEPHVINISGWETIMRPGNESEQVFGACVSFENAIYARLHFCLNRYFSLTCWECENDPNLCYFNVISLKNCN